MSPSVLLSCHSFKVKSIKLSTFSNIPYTAFKTNSIYTDLKAKLNVNSQFKKFKFRKTIVALRAPKHFKVGRQHYSIGTRASHHTVVNKTHAWVVISAKTPIIYLLKSFYKTPNIVLKQPLTALKTIHILFSVKFRFKEVV